MAAAAQGPTLARSDIDMRGEVDDHTERDKSFNELLGEQLDAAKAASGWSEAQIARAAGLSKQKVSSWRKRTLPKDPAQLRRLIEVISTNAPGTSGADWERIQRAARRPEPEKVVGGGPGGLAPDSVAEGRLRSSLGGRALLITDLRSRHAAMLGVRPAPQLGPRSPADLDSYLTTYVARESDLLVRRSVLAAVSGGFVLLSGAEGVGKTRALYEVVVSGLRGFPVVVPIPAQPDVIESLCAARGELPRFILWLDGLERFLRRPGGPAADGLHEWLGSLLDSRVIIVGTVRQDDIDEIRWCGASGFLPDAARVIDQLGADHVLVRPISPTDWRTYDAAKGDPRLETAIAHADHRDVTGTLIHLSDLERRYDRHRGLGKAIVDTLVDLRRLGWRSPVPASFLREACRSHENGLSSDREWAAAMTDLSGQLESPPTDADRSDSCSGESWYRLPRYVYSYADQVDPQVRADPRIWDALVAVRASIPQGDLVLLAGAALDRLLLDHALALYERAAGEGMPYAGEWVAQILARRGQLDLLRERASDDPCAARWLGACLAAAGDPAAAADVLAPHCGRTSSVDSVVADLAEWVRTLRACTRGHCLDGLDRMRQLDLIGSGSARPADPSTAGAATWVPDVSIPPATGRKRLAADFSGSGGGWAAIERYHRAGFRTATRQLARVLFHRNEPEQALEVLRPLIACHDDKAVALASTVRLVLPERVDRWGISNRSRVEHHRDQATRADAARRVQTLSELVVGQGFFELAELLAISWYELDVPQAARNLRRFGLTTGGTPAGAPRKQNREDRP